MDTDGGAEQQESTKGEDSDYTDKSDSDTWVDRSKIDFDPDDGLLSGTAIDGGTSIPGPHEIVDDVDPDDESDESDGDKSDGDKSEGE